MRAIQITEWGGPEVLRLVSDAPEPEAGPGQVLIRVSRAGINFADTHARENSYLARYELPMVPGAEVAGVVAQAGNGFEEGERVVALVGGGGYAEYAVAPAPMVHRIPEGVSDGQALAVLLQGLTAWHLYRTQGRVSEGESVLIQAAAGGVGSLAVQLGRAFGAGRVIGVASSEAKRELVLSLGADAVIDASPEGMAERVIEANGGRRVDVIFEMAGGPVFDESMKALNPRGRCVTYGIASREPNQVRTGDLMRRSQSVVGFWLMHYLEDMAEPLAELFSLIASGSLRVVEGTTYPLSQARQAHEDMQARKTSGKLLLDPAS
jgi:NADPH2:quinone reductase